MKQISQSEFNELKVVDLEGFKFYCPRCGAKKIIKKHIIKHNEQTGKAMEGVITIDCPCYIMRSDKHFHRIIRFRFK